MSGIKHHFTIHRLHLEITHAVHYFENIVLIIMFYNYEDVVMHSIVGHHFVL